MKKWKKVLLHVLTVLLLMAGVCGYFLFLYPHEQDFVESYYKVQSDKLTSHLRIVQLSDLHLREFGENNCDLVARIRALKPDIIAITGDMNDKKSDDTHVVTDLCAQLVEIAPVYYVPGNHEWPKIVFEGSTLASDLEALGVHFLADKYETVTIGSNTLLIGGIAEAPASYEKYASGFLEDFAAQPGYKMLLVHYPEYYAEDTGALRPRARRSGSPSVPRRALHAGSGLPARFDRRRADDFRHEGYHQPRTGGRRGADSAAHQ